MTGTIVFLISLLYVPSHIVVFDRSNFSAEKLVDSIRSDHSVVLMNLSFNDTLFIGEVSGRIYSIGSNALAGIVLSKVRDLELVGFKITIIPKGYVSGLVIYNSSNVIVRNIRIIGSNIVVASSSNVTIDGCMVSGSTFPVIIVKNSSGIIVTHCVFNDSYAGFLIDNSYNVIVRYNNISVKNYLVKAYNSDITIYGCNIPGSSRVDSAGSTVSLCTNGVGNYYAGRETHNCSSDRPFDVVLPSFSNPLESKRLVGLVKNIGILMGIVLLLASFIFYTVKRR